jgi:MFS transporter, DHA3 family, macrolide efflux protein
MVNVCFWLPTLILGPLSGVIVDRYKRKTLYLVVNGIRGLLLIIIGIKLEGRISLDFIYLVSLCQGVLFSIGFPVTMALVREIVAKDALLVANAVVDIAYEVGNVVGMSLSGFVIALLGLPYTFITSGLLFVLATLLASLMQVRANITKTTSLSLGNLFSDLHSGIRYIFSVKYLWVIYTIQLLLVIAYNTIPVLISPFSSIVLHANVTQFGFIEGMLSLGIILGGICVPSLVDRFGFRWVLLSLLLIFPIFYTWFAFNRNIAVAACINAIIGFGFALWPVVVTQAQHSTELAFQGRVQSSFNCLSAIGVLMNYGLLDSANQHIALPRLFGIEAMLSCIAIILVLSYFKIWPRKE